MKKLIFLFFIIFLEGYVVLSAELLAIRQVIPFVGSGTDTVSIIIAAVLMPLAVGYFVGGQFKNKGRVKTVRKKLLNNIFIAAVFFLFGLSYITVGFFFETLTQLGVQNRILSTTIYSLIFLVVPVFLLAQTIPLVSHYFSKEKLSEITGKMLFFSTVGSFMGAIFSTLILMAYIGVHHTTTITILCLTALYILLTRKKLSERAIIMVAILAASLYLNSDKAMQQLNIVENNKYNTIRVTEKNNGKTRVLSMNNNNSSLFTEKEFAIPNDNTGSTQFRYVSYIEQHILPELELSDKTHNILIIGAGGFTMGLYDDKNNYTFVDIDGSLKKVAEDYFLKQKLGSNKKFAPVPARAFVYDAVQNNKKYDLIILDAYLGDATLPEHLVTEEFFGSMRNVLSDKGMVVANFIISPTFTTAFSQKIDNTLRRVYPHVSRQILGNVNFWDRDSNKSSNVLYIYNHRDDETNGIYTDNINRVFYDKHKAME